MVAPVYTLYMDQNRLGPLEKPLRMTDMSVMLRREEKENNKKKRSKNYRKKTEIIRTYGRFGTYSKLTPKILSEGSAKLCWAGRGKGSHIS